MELYKQLTCVNNDYLKIERDTKRNYYFYIFNCKSIVTFPKLNCNFFSMIYNNNNLLTFLKNILFLFYMHEKFSCMYVYALFCLIAIKVTLILWDRH